ncbi:conserved hypothetical protein [Vibrio chagasii]|nr:conserved hypothetical protein [Vibrio chagasii]
MRLVQLTVMMSFFFASYVSAQVIVKGALKGERLHWISAVTASQQAGVLKPAHGLFAPKVSSTKSWLPGAIIQAPTKITLLNQGQSVTFAIEVLGLEYSVANQLPTQKENNQQACSSDYFNGQVIQVMGRTCYANNSLHMLQESNPFSSLSPLFKVEESAIKQAFNGKLAGVYRGQITFQYQFKWQNRSGVWVSTQDSQSIMFEILHQPSEITKITVVRQDEIKTDYDYFQNRNSVSGETRYHVEVEGQYLNALKLELQNRRYQLLGGGSQGIPYSIECEECETPQLVDNGSLINSYTTLRGGSRSSLPFTLRVYLSDVDLEGIERGRFSDTFTLLVSPGV